MRLDRITPLVIPAEAGIHYGSEFLASAWTPAFAGVTKVILS